MCVEFLVIYLSTIFLVFGEIHVSTVFLVFGEIRESTVLLVFGEIGVSAVHKEHSKPAAQHLTKHKEHI